MIEEKLKANGWRYTADDEKEVIYVEDALSICQQEIEDAKPKWISVKDRLPELYRLNMSKDVLIFAGSKHLVGVYDYELNRWSTSAYITVTHWMPLPESPEVKE